MYNHLTRNILAKIICVFGVRGLTRIVCILCIHCNTIREILWPSSGIELSFRKTVICQVEAPPYEVMGAIFSIKN
jgi:hypothetical protein